MNERKSIRKTKHKYCVISKVGNNHFVKYNTSDLIKFYDFIISKYSDYRYSNVYCKNSRLQVGTLSVKRRPTERRFSA